MAKVRVGKAQIACAVCPHCKGEVFKVFLDCRDLNVQIDEDLSVEQSKDLPLAGVECAACGEEYRFTTGSTGRFTKLG